MIFFFFLLRRLLIVVLMSLTVGATIFDYATYSELMTWQWNKGMYDTRLLIRYTVFAWLFAHYNNISTVQKTHKTSVLYRRMTRESFYFYSRVRIENWKSLIKTFYLFSQNRDLSIWLCASPVDEQCKVWKTEAA